MNEVSPIRERKKIEAMKRVLKGQSIRDYLMFMIGISSALRISDILNLRVKDVWDGRKCNNQISIREGKTNKIKRFSMSKNLEKAVNEYMGSYDYTMNDYLMMSRKGDNKPITRQQAHLILKNAASMVGIKEAISTHSLRKTFAYHAWKSGVDLALLQDLLNHSSAAYTRRYIGIRQEDRDEIYQSLNL